MSDASDLLSLLQRDLAKAEARIEIMQAEIIGLRADVRTLLNFISEAKGGWKMLLISAAVAGAVGAGLAHVIGLFTFKG